MPMLNFIEFLQQYGLTPEQYERALQDAHDKVLEEKDLDWQRIVDDNKLPMSKDTVRKACSGQPFGSVYVTEYFRQKAISSDKMTGDEQSKYGVKTEINKDGSYSSDRLIAITSDDLKNPESLLSAHGFTTKEWELVSARNSIWNAQSKTRGIQELYSSKIVVKPKKFEMSLSDIEEWFSALDRQYSIPQLRTHTDTNGDKLLLIDIADLHMNLQASMFVTGNQYNCDIAEHLFFYVISNIVERTKHQEFAKIIFCIGGDMLNADNIQGTTTKGTPQDNELHLYEAYQRASTMTIKAIEILKVIAPVDVIHIPANHDNQTGFKMAMYANAWFRNDDRVNVDYSPIPRKYVVFGNTLLVFAHDGDVKKLPKIIADEAREYWSDVETVEVFLQHLHSEAVLLEEHNMRIQRLPTISAKSEWTVSKGFGSKRQCKSFIFDKEDGLLDILYTPIRIEK